VLKHNKPRPRVAHRGIARLIRSSHGHSTPSLKISCKSVQSFSRNLANKETKKERNKEIDRKQYPVPRSIGDGVIKTNTYMQCIYRMSVVILPANISGFKSMFSVSPSGNALVAVRVKSASVVSGKAIIYARSKSN